MASVVGRVMLGAVAGAIGTLAMDLVWFKRYRDSGGMQGFVAWDTSEGTTTYEDAPAPAKTAQAVAAKLDITLPDSSARLVNNAVHWITGIGWGKAHALATGVLGTTSPVFGVLTGVTAWGTSYATLAPLGIYEPIWEYDNETLWKDLSAHLVYGATMGVAFRLLTRKR
ncbi:MAG: hypothetical protein KJN63_06815 [Acidimicrobiia bacterium]|nr:hypothetical protein [Acidimicrobiia bacterium]